MASGQQGNPLVSICIPVWGSYSKYLKEALQSAKSQTYPEVEIIIASGKETLPNARNEAIKKSHGSWILPLDADDKLDPQYLEKTVGKSDIVTTYHRDWEGRVGDYTCDYTVENFLDGNKIISGSLYKREVWETLGGYDEAMTEGYEDADFWLRAVVAGYKIVMIPEALYWYRKHDDSMINQTVKKDKEIREYVINKYKHSNSLLSGN